MLKNIMRVIKVMVCCAAITASSYARAEVSHIPVGIECGYNSVDATFEGRPGVQLTITTEGLREGTELEVKAIEAVDGESKTSDGTPVKIEAICVPSGKSAEISLTNSSLVCKKGEEIIVSVSKPTDIRYTAILTLTATRDKEAVAARLSEVQKKFNAIDEMFRSVGPGLWISGQSILQSIF